LTAPFPPGTYPVVVIGSGPGAIQASYSLRHLGVDHAVISADPSPGGMFRRWPFLQRLLSWTKPHAPVDRGTRAYERYDWNSLLGEEPATRALQPGLMDGTSYFPSRAEMEANLVAFVDRAGLPIRYGCRWIGTQRESGPDGETFAVETTDGFYRCQAMIVAVGVAQPYTPPGPGMELTHHYADVRPVESYAGRRVFIVGKQNSGFELATGLLPWARQIVLASPSQARLSVDTRSLVGIRARYVQPFEDFVLGGGVSVLDAAIDRIERAAGGELVVHLRRTDGGADLVIEVDDAIAATGFVTPLVDLPALGVATFGASQLPAQTPWWESASVSGIFFAGTIGQGSKGLRKHGIPANSGAVHGARYNARVLAGYLARTRFGVEPDRPLIAPDAVATFLATELAESPELFHQRGYLARVLTADGSGGLRDDGVQPLAHVLDSDGPDSIVASLEADGTGAIYPVIYSRIGGKVVERVIDPDPLLRYDTSDTRLAISDLAGRVAVP
ncbi:MAG TPA: NAD(P)-binding domain-containing protein, partial [Candidatus Limnocylindrales bacterium]|nr:NAD(P)-binding domain-containing protein [Candidatus Limnocylindrales bacterium]